MRPRDAGNVRIEPVVVLRADDPLKDHRHLLFLEPVRRRPNVGLRARRKHRRVHALDGARQLAQPYFRLGMAVRQHVRLVHAGERLILRVFEQARRSDRDRISDDVEERREVAHHRVGKLRGDEAAADLLLVGERVCGDPHR